MPRPPRRSGRSRSPGLWSELLGAHGLTAAQLLLTLEDLEDRRRYLNAAATLGRLLGAGAVPVINENDSVATAEIRFGDNDRLAARVAQAAQAQAVVLLSDVDGLYDRDPREKGAQLLPRVEEVTEAVHAMASGASASGLGSGGMISKLQAAEIADPRRDHAGDRQRHASGAARARARRRRSARCSCRRGATGRARPGSAGASGCKGALAVDAGCARALLKGGSLLASGITGGRRRVRARRSGRGARRGRQAGRAGPRRIRRGRSRARSSGRRSEEHAALLGYAPRSAVIHRDQLVLL